MWKRQVLAFLTLLLIVPNVLAVTTYTQSKTNTISLTGQGNDGYTAPSNSVPSLFGSSCLFYGSIIENVGTLQGNHTTGQTLGPHPAGSYSFTFNQITCAFVVVISCNWFQLQCWWFPSLMLILFLSIPLSVAIKGEAERKGIAYISLVSLAFGSGIEVMMGIMTIAMPLVLTVAAIVYAWRVL